MPEESKIGNKDYGDEAPRLKHFVVVLIVLVALILFSWLAFYIWHLTD